MNYDQRSNLQKKLKDFTLDELQELMQFVLQKEIDERTAKQEKQTLFLTYI